MARGTFTSLIKMTSLHFTLFSKTKINKKSKWAFSFTLYLGAYKIIFLINTMHTFKDKEHIKE